MDQDAPEPHPANAAHDDAPDERAAATSDAPTRGRELDLLTVGLVVFFVAVIAVVAAMLLLSRIG